MSVLLEVPFVYTVKGRAPRERIPTIITSVGLVPVKIREVSSDEAPVVARCRYQALKPSLVELPGGPRISGVRVSAEVDYRMLDGRLMRRALLDADRFFAAAHINISADAMNDRAMGDAIRQAVESAEVVPVTREIAQSAMHLLANGVTQGCQTLIPRKPGDPAPRSATPPTETRRLNRIDFEDRQLRAAEMAEAIQEGAAFVDGVLYVPTFGPGYLFDRRRGAAYYATATIELSDPTFGEVQLQGGDEKLIEQVVAWDSEQSREEITLEWEGEVEILDKAALSVLKPEELSLWEIGKRLDGNIETLVKAMKSPAVLHALGDVMAAMNDQDGDPYAMVPAFTSLVAELQARGDEADWTFYRLRNDLEDVLDRLEWRRNNPDLTLSSVDGCEPDDLGMRPSP